MFYQDYEKFGTDNNAINVRHSCGCEVVCTVGGTSERYDEERATKKAELELLPCDQCRPKDYFDADHPLPNEIRFISSRLGHGVLTTEGFVLDKPVLHRDDGVTRRRRIFSPIVCGYLHADTDHEHTEVETAWIDEAIIRGAVKHNRNRFTFGATLRNWDQLEEAERRLGKKIPLNG